MSQPNFYAIIPASVRYDSTIIPNAKLLYGEITAMCNSEGYCWAENSYFATLYGVSMYTISRWISQLEKGNYINTELNKKEGNTRKIFIVDASVTLLTKSAKPIDEKRKRVLTKSANQYMRILQLIIQLIEKVPRSVFLKLIILLNLKD